VQHLRDITDPEHPYTLEQLNVVSEDLISIDDAAGLVRFASSLALRCSSAVFLRCFLLSLVAYGVVVASGAG
jgi:hypothetical protein